MEDHGRRFTVQVDETRDPIAGRVIDQRGASVPFTGWLGLASELQRLFQSNPSADNTRDAADTGSSSPREPEDWGS